MKVIPLSIPDVLAIDRDIFEDSRGSFSELWRPDRYAAVGVAGPFMQDNFSRSKKGVLRGLHYQWPRSQGKLVSVLEGAVFDVAVDLRKGSPNYGAWVSEELSEQNGRQLWIPRGFAHGFVVLSESALFHYKVDAPYAREDEITIAWNDQDIGIAWPLHNPILGLKDAEAPSLSAIPTDRLPDFSPQ